MQETTHAVVTTPKRNVISPIAIIGALFFIFGFVTWLNTVLVPYLKIACELNNRESFLVASAFYIAYLVMAAPSTWILKKFGFKNGMSIGLAVIAIGALIFIPAALTRTYTTFLIALFVQGAGLAILQTASNPYVVVLGPIESAAKRISIMGICNKTAGGLAPLILGSIILNDGDELKAKLAPLTGADRIPLLNELASRVITPYICFVITFLILAVLIYFSTLPEIDTEKEDETTALANTGKTSIFQFPHLLLGVIALFLYVGAEVLSGDSIVLYASSQHILLKTGKFFATCTMVSMIAGYLAGVALIPKYISQQKALIVCAILGLLFSITILITHGYVSVFFVAFLGLANSLMWPALWPLALNGLGKFTKKGSSLLIMGIAGGSAIPYIYGLLGDVFTLHSAYGILLIIYLFILFYATTGHKAGGKVTRPMP